MIFVRESQGIEELERLGEFNNIRYSPDMVLTNRKEVNWKYIYKRDIHNREFDILPNSVAVIPNMRNFDHGNRNNIMNIYKEAIRKILSEDKNVYLIRHSGEDLKACIMIKEMFAEDSKVMLIQDDMTPAEFENLIKQFDFSIGSRFHSIVHAYKECVPCLILGWAIKYRSLAELFGQSDYVFDVRDSDMNNAFLLSLDKMFSMFNEEKNNIAKILANSNDLADPFDVAFEMLDSK